MILPDKKIFFKLYKQNKIVPVYKEIVSDLETPVSAFSKIAGKYSFLLESVTGGERLARYSFLGSSPFIIIKIQHNKLLTINPVTNKIIETAPYTTGAFKKILNKYNAVYIEELPRFHGGAVGYFSYDFVRTIENIPRKNKKIINAPDACFAFYKNILAFDHVKNKIIIIANILPNLKNPKKAYQNAIKEINLLEKKLLKPHNLKPLSINLNWESQKQKVKSNLTKKEFISMVKKAKEYIFQGDIFQVVLSQQLRIPKKKNNIDIYRSLRSINPSPYMFYLKFDDISLIGSSPEIHVQLNKRNAVLRPIAGTHPRGKDEKDDKIIIDKLLNDEKEKAEHIMLVDLGRNDLGRVCDFESVKVTELMTIEKYSHVMHIVSNVEGIVNNNFDSLDLMNATFPAGTVTGAPKIRAMEIINELENIERGPYAGAVAYFDFSGNLDSCITIRTIVLHNNTAYIQAGAGIVADSVPEKEYDETLNKAKGMIQACL